MFKKKKTTRIVTMIIAGVLVLAMLVPMILSLII